MTTGGHTSPSPPALQSAPAAAPSPNTSSQHPISAADAEILARPPFPPQQEKKHKTCFAAVYISHLRRDSASREHCMFAAMVFSPKQGLQLWTELGRAL